MYKISELFDLEKTMAGEYLKSFSYPWESLSGISKLILSVGQSLDEKEYYRFDESIWVHKSAEISETAYIGAPCIIGAESEIRHSAFIRSSALIGEGCVVGNSTEIKNAILFNKVQVPHFNYVGDSILGYKAHLGAGSVTSNVKSDKSCITVKFCGNTIETGLKKFGAIIGDGAEIGCNTVINPGTIIGKYATVYPLSSVRGAVPEGCIYKSPHNIVAKG